MVSKTLSIALISLLLMVSIAGAVEISVSPAKRTTYVNERGDFVLRITNNGENTEGFSINIYGSNVEWSLLEYYYVVLSPNESKDVRISIIPQKEGKYSYRIRVFNSNNPDEYDEASFSLNVLHERLFFIKDFSAKADEKQTVISFTLEPKRTINVEVEFEIVNSDGNRVKYAKTTRFLDSSTKISETFDTENMLSGTYTARVTVKGDDYSLTKETHLFIRPVHRIITKRKVVSNPFSEDVIITIRNEGNVVEDYLLKENVKKNEFLELIDTPDSAVVTGDLAKYRWKIEGLAVGKEVVIRYRIKKWPRLVGFILVFMGVVGLLGLGSIKVRRPSIRKKYLKKKDGFFVIIEVRGPLTRRLKNVMVRDRVSPLGKVLRDFEGPKPVIREGESGTDLIWRIGEIKPRSEVILTYKIKPLIRAEQLKMPRAYLIYTSDEDDRRVKIYSKPLILE